MHDGERRSPVLLCLDLLLLPFLPGLNHTAVRPSLLPSQVDVQKCYPNAENHTTPGLGGHLRMSFSLELFRLSPDSHRWTIKCRCGVVTCNETKRQVYYPKMLARFSVLLLFVWLAAAGPIQRRDSPITIPFTRRTNFGGSSTLREIDQARAKALYSRSQAGTAPKARSVFNVPATNGVVDYTVSVSTLSGSSSKRSSDYPW